jgi:hypothetical protein
VVEDVVDGQADQAGDGLGVEQQQAGLYRFKMS